MRYSKKTSKDGIFTCVKNEPISQCENHEILSVTQEGDHRALFVTYKCKIHNETIKRAKGLVLSKGCVACVTEGLRKNREKLFLRNIRENTNEGDFKLLSVYGNAKQKIDIRHNVCGKVFTTTSDKFTRTYKCLYCTNKMYNCETLEKYHNRHSKTYLKEGFQIIVDKPNKKLIDRTKFQVKHLSCGNTVEVSHSTFYNSGLTCKYCRSTNSRVHSIVHATLEDNNIDYEPEYRFEDCKNKYTLPFDFKVNISDSRFILIEVDGQQHYRDSNVGYYKDTFRSIKKNDDIKNKYCEDNNIVLHRLKVSDYKTIDAVVNKLKTIIPVEKIPDYTTVDRLYSNKITPEIVENVRFRYSNNITVRKLCDDYNISDRSVRNILWYNIYPEILSHLKPKIDGITANNSNKPPRRDSQLLPYKDDIFKLRDTQALSYEKIGAKYGVSGSCVRTFYIRNS